MPHFAEELARSHDDDGEQRVNSFTGRYDSRNVMIHAMQADRATQDDLPLLGTIPRESSARSEI